MSPNRRTFLKSTALLAGAALLPSRRLAGGDSIQHIDEELCLRRFAMAEELSLATQPISEVMVAVGRSFIGSPYVAATLETPGEEELVVNLRGLDCVTFVENTLALARCIKRNRQNFEAFKEELRCIRYRGGNISGYPSRLHYFSEWIQDNEQMGIVRNVTEEAGGTRYTKTINFMSTHRSSYPQLQNIDFYDAIKRTERELNRREWSFIRKEVLSRHQHGIIDGDIIAITTSIEGLDISHTGMAVWVDGVLKYLHAPLTNGKVQITEKSLLEYLASNKNQTGIMIARPLDPDPHE